MIWYILWDWEDEWDASTIKDCGRQAINCHMLSVYSTVELPTFGCVCFCRANLHIELSRHTSGNYKSGTGHETPKDFVQSFTWNLIPTLFLVPCIHISSIPIFSQKRSWLWSKVVKFDAVGLWLVQCQWPGRGDGDREVWMEGSGWGNLESSRIEILNYTGKGFLANIKIQPAILRYMKMWMKALLRYEARLWRICKPSPWYMFDFSKSKQIAEHVLWSRVSCPVKHMAF